MVPSGAELYVFNPSLITPALEIVRRFAKCWTKIPRAKVLIIGPGAYAPAPGVSMRLDVTIVRRRGRTVVLEAGRRAQRHPRRGRRRQRSADLDHLPFSRLDAIRNRQKIQVCLRLHPFPDGTDSAKPRLHVHLQLLPVHHRGKCQRGFRTPESVFEELQHGHREIRLPLVQVPRSAFRPGP